MNHDSNMNCLIFVLKHFFPSYPFMIVLELEISVSKLFGKNISYLFLHLRAIYQFARLKYMHYYVGQRIIKKMEVFALFCKLCIQAGF